MSLPVTRNTGELGDPGELRFQLSIKFKKTKIRESELAKLSQMIGTGHSSVTSHNPLKLRVTREQKHSRDSFAVNQSTQSSCLSLVSCGEIGTFRETLIMEQSPGLSIF